MRKERADLLLFQQGLAQSREQAKRLIMAGEAYWADNAEAQEATRRRVDKPGQLFASETFFFLRETERFVSRGAYKLLTLIEHCALDVRDFVCLDAGASTGGFTDCLLQHGAARVYAIDVGHNQLHERLRSDPRVISHEGVNLRNPPPDLLPESVDLVVCDVSFISLTLVLPPCMRWLKADGRLAVLIKPQFELGIGETVRGIVRDPLAQKRACEKIVRFCDESLGLNCQELLPAKIKGPKGNQEFMALFVRS